MYTFDYQRPASREAALAAAQGDARFLAGGQSLVQAMRLRLSATERMVDLGGIADLAGITVDAQQVTIGAMTTHAAVAASGDVRRAIPALAELAGNIGDPSVRNMGTLGGSIANSDPAACYPSALLALDATVHTNKRQIAAASFFTGLYETALDAGELVVSVSFPIPKRAAYMKYRQPASHFALVGVFVSEGAGGVRVAVTGAGPFVFRAKELEAALGKQFTPDALNGITIAADNLNTDMHGTAAYRAAMVTVMAQRAVAKAIA
ncbi:carbon monoxide dehydrogenase [Caenimonas koreensis DSM 17982]|uniref:Carbon monoxide dehydrogenase n=1 Tax=Caenimonas koreensis DSM 17982 TaxID=1121255 RepID=A0A844B7A1_9BURK|nr:xanthine dehydrogenase family protein subunit M [Caenimonas koreensis]MRD46421.1 carbon monoxide dehydrogenase [Caenimonas koreensis DSM 17982]